MQTRESRLAIVPSVHHQPNPANRNAPCLPALERMLVEALAAARDAVARCEHALVMLAALQRLEPGGSTPTAWDARDLWNAQHGSRADHSRNGVASPMPPTDSVDTAAPRHATPREMQVLHLIAAGMRNKEIAAELCVSGRTIERHITNVYRKIGARGKADATNWVVQHRLV